MFLKHAIIAGNLVFFILNCDTILKRAFSLILNKADDSVKKTKDTLSCELLWDNTLPNLLVSTFTVTVQSTGNFP